MILVPRQDQRVRWGQRTGKVVRALGMLAYVRWDDTGEISSVNGAYLEPASSSRTRTSRVD